jgi:putative membrane protein
LVDALHFLSREERDRIRRAVETVQASTAAKFEFAARPASDHYALYPVVWSAVASLVLTGALALVRPHLGIATGFIVNAALFVVLAVVLDWWPIRVRLVPRHIRRLACSRAAHREFATRLISKDDAHNGVMLYVSLAEHHIEIIAEREAHAKVPPGTWDRIIAGATSTMRSGGLTAGLVAAIAACGAALSAAFPAGNR